MQYVVIRPDTLEMLCRTLEASFQTIAMEGNALDAKTKERIRISLAQIIMDAFQGGEDDPEKLKQIAVNRFSPPPDAVG